MQNETTKGGASNAVIGRVGLLVRLRNLMINEIEIESDCVKNHKKYSDEYKNGIYEGFRLSKIILDEEIAELRNKEVKSNRVKEVLHGVDCKKAQHQSHGGYLHGADDDLPYDVDGCSYCGRCHTAI